MIYKCLTITNPQAVYENKSKFFSLICICFIRKLNFNLLRFNYLYYILFSFYLFNSLL